MEQRLRRLLLALHFTADNNFAVFETFKQKVLALLVDFEGDESIQSPENQKLYTDMVLDRLKTGGENAHLAWELLNETIGLQMSPPITLLSLWVKWAMIRNKETRNEHHHKDADRRNKDVEKCKPDSDGDAEPCKACGKPHGGQCRALQYHHPDANYTDTPWAESEAGKLWASHGRTSMVFREHPDGSRLEKSVDKGDGSKKKTFEKGKKQDFKKPHSKSELLFDNLMSVGVRDSDDYTMSCDIYVNNNKLTLNAFFDTGATQSNYVDEKTANWIKAHLDQARLHAQMDALNSAHTCVSCAKTSVLNSVSCIACNNKKYINQEDFIMDIDLTYGNNKTSCSKRKRSSSPKKGSKTKQTKVTTLSTSDDQASSLYSNKRTKVCTAIKGVCTESTGEVTFDFKYLNEKLNKYEEIKAMTAQVLDTRAPSENKSSFKTI